MAHDRPNVKSAAITVALDFLHDRLPWPLRYDGIPRDRWLLAERLRKQLLAGPFGQDDPVLAVGIFKAVIGTADPELLVDTAERIALGAS